MRYRILLSLLFSMGFICVMQAQCYGPQTNFLSGKRVRLSQFGGSFNTFMGSENFQIKFESGSTGKVIISSTTGLEFLVDPNNTSRVMRVTDLETLSSGTYEAGPKELFNSTTQIGPFGAGLTGYIGVRMDGATIGWIELGQSGTTVCNPGDYEFSIENRCYCQDNLGEENFNNSISSGLYPADISISSNSSVINCNNVFFRAGETINLLPEFAVELGSLFETIMAGCK